MDKSEFISTELFISLQQLHADAIAKWGKMNAQQMVEHLIDFIDLSVEKIHFPLAVPEEDLPKYKTFLMSEKPFRENTKAPATVLGENPLPAKLNSLQSAVHQLKISVSDFFSFFAKYPDKKTLHPAFGWLNFEQWLMLHYKHISHHLRQFELIPNN
jgi:oxepin-CoA hydrolase/3-oxo-5,6-dehydrosuberyl-CoA semialdehyde dehydrogenase